MNFGKKVNHTIFSLVGSVVINSMLLRDNGPEFSTNLKNQRARKVALGFHIGQLEGEQFLSSR